MKRINESQDHPLRFEVGGKVIGQFYNSWDKMYHLAEYVPYERPPHAYLCEKTGNFSPSRSEHNRPLCAECWSTVLLTSGTVGTTSTEAAVGDTVTVTLHDENGNGITETGTVEEVLE